MFFSWIFPIFDLKCIFYWLANVACPATTHTWQPPFPLRPLAMGASFGTSNWKWRQKGALRMQFFALFLLLVCFCECVCVYFLCMSALSYANKSATPRHMSHLAEASVRGGGGGFEMGVTASWRLAAVRKNISHTICHTRYNLCPVVAKGWQQA